MTGWFRDGCCNTNEEDVGFIPCVKVSDEFLQWCKQAGNDLITPHPNLVFLDLKMAISGASVQVFMQER